ncbi:MAG: hypothetical protein AAF846_05335 [Chloroflexota bacterium]
MSQQVMTAERTEYTTGQYALFAITGFVIWVLGVVIVRLAGSSVFSADSILLPVFFSLSIPIAFVNTYATRPIFRLQMREMLVPVLVMVFITLMLDGLAISFTDIYSTDGDIVRYAGGWLLWSFGVQVVVSMWIIRQS